ncbi:MAG: hypothetical protein COB13_011575 [OCS116 cluster bacterium]|nr:hypothetical protein [OCS116 cluster bacterium]
MTGYKRTESDLAQCTDQWGWTYHHMGIPSAKKLPNMRHIPHLGMWVSGFDTSPYGVEWMYFDKDSIIDPLIQKVPHPAFVVPNLREAIKGKQLMGEPSIPSKGIKVAMILHNGAPVELMQFDE